LRSQLDARHDAQGRAARGPSAGAGMRAPGERADSAPAEACPPAVLPWRIHSLRVGGSGGGGDDGGGGGGAAQVFMSLETREELDAVRARAAVGLVVELEPLSGAQRKELLTHLVTKYNTAVQTELARQKAEMRLKAEAELARLREERQQRCACEAAARARAARCV
jgi:hypothetical protein